MKKILLVLAFALVLAGCGSDDGSWNDAVLDDAATDISVAKATENWPAEGWGSAKILTGLDADFQKNLSGVHWNDLTGTLWLGVNSPGRVVALTYDDSKGDFSKAGKWSVSGDIESVTQVELNESFVYVIDEGTDKIRKYDVSSATAVLKREWNISPYVPAYVNGAGSEGMVFIPDKWLALSGLGVSKNGMGGLMFVAHQNGGSVYAFDLYPDKNELSFAGYYKTSRNESSGLEFDRSNGILYVWHNTGSNYLELTDLTTYTGTDGLKHFTTVKEYFGPKTGNLEGVALTPHSSGRNWFFIVDDDNQNGAALMWFKNFTVELPEPLKQPQTIISRISTSTDDVEELASGKINTNSSDLEMTKESSVQTVGLRFNTLGIPSGSKIISAYIQFVTDEVSIEETNLKIEGEGSGNALPFTTAAFNVSSRERTLANVLWSPSAWNIIDEAGANQRTTDLSAIVQEIIDDPMWEEGDSAAFIITGSGKRVARSFNRSASLAPLLRIEFTTSGGMEEEPLIMLDRRISSGANDAEEFANGKMYINSTDLELVTDSSVQKVGLRFEAVDVPYGATIESAYVQFAVDELSSTETSLVIAGEFASEPALFGTAAGDISGRELTSSEVEWLPPAWNVIGEAGENQRTPDISSIVQEIVDISEWKSGKPMVLVITGSGKRVAESFEGDKNLAPVLHIEYKE